MSRKQNKSVIGASSISGGLLVPIGADRGKQFYKVVADNPYKTDSVYIGPNNKNGLAVDNGEIIETSPSKVRVASADLGVSNLIERLAGRFGLSNAFNKAFNKQEKFKKANNLNDDGTTSAKFGLETETNPNIKKGDGSMLIVKSEEDIKREEEQAKAAKQDTIPVKFNGAIKRSQIPTKNKTIIIDDYSPRWNYIVEGDKIYYSRKGLDNWVDISDNNTARKNLFNHLKKYDFKGYEDNEADIAKDIIIGNFDYTKYRTEENNKILNANKPKENIKAEYVPKDFSLVNPQEQLPVGYGVIKQNNDVKETPVTVKQDSKIDTATKSSEYSPRNFSLDNSTIIEESSPFFNKDIIINKNNTETPIKTQSTAKDRSKNLIIRALANSSNSDLRGVSEIMTNDGVVKGGLDILNKYITRQRQKRHIDDDVYSGDLQFNVDSLKGNYGIIPGTFTGDTIRTFYGKKLPNQYIIPESIDAGEYTFGYRNRGNYEPINTEGAVLTTHKPFSPLTAEEIEKGSRTYKNYKGGAKEFSTFIGLDENGNLKAGNISQFKEGDMIAGTWANEIYGFPKDKNGNYIYKEDSKHGNKNSNVPAVNVLNEETGQIEQRFPFNILVGKKDTAGSTYGGSSGGRYLVKVGNETRILSGSVRNIEQEFEAMKKRQGVESGTFYTLDNGFYNKGLRTYNKKITTSDLKKYEETGGGHFLYLKDKVGDKFPTDTTLSPHFRNENSSSYKVKGHPLKNENKGVVLHYTAFPDQTLDNLTNYFLNPIQNPKDPEYEASAHVAIGKNGERRVFVPEDKVAFHAGKSMFNGKDNVNDFMHGIEFQAAGPNVPLTDAQVKSAVEYLTKYIRKYNIPIENVVTHQLVRDNYMKATGDTKGRKQDLSPAQYKQIMDALIGTVYYKKPDNEYQDRISFKFGGKHTLVKAENGTEIEELNPAIITYSPTAKEKYKTAIKKYRESKKEHKDIDKQIRRFIKDGKTEEDFWKLRENILTSSNREELKDNAKKARNEYLGTLRNRNNLIPTLYRAYSRHFGYDRKPHENIKFGNGTDIIDLSNNAIRITDDTKQSTALFNEYVENERPSVLKAEQYKNNPNRIIGDDHKFPASNISIFSGIEDGKFRLDSLNNFADSTLIFPARHIQRNIPKATRININKVVPDSVVVGKWDSRDLSTPRLTYTLEDNALKTAELEKLNEQGTYGYKQPVVNYARTEEGRNSLESIIEETKNNEVLDNKEKRRLINQSRRALNGRIPTNDVLYNYLSENGYMDKETSGPYRAPVTENTTPHLNNNMYRDIEYTVTDENGETHPISIYNAGVLDNKTIIANPNGGLMVGRIQDISKPQLDSLNNYLSKNPSWITRYDLGRYASYYLDEPSLKEYLGQYVENINTKDPNLYVVGTKTPNILWQSKKLGGTINKKQNMITKRYIPSTGNRKRAAEGIETTFYKQKAPFGSRISSVFNQPVDWANIINLGVNTAGNIISHGITNRAIKKLTFEPQPIAQQAAKLKTSFNINPTLAEIDNTLIDYERGLNNNVASSQTRNARTQQFRKYGIDAYNKAYAQKENAETQLINQDRLNTQSIEGQNLERYLKWNKELNDFNNQKILSKAKNDEDMVIGIGNAMSNSIQQGAERRRDKETNAIKLASAVLANPDVVQDEETKKMVADFISGYLRDGVAYMSRRRCGGSKTIKRK